MQYRKRPHERDARAVRGSLRHGVGRVPGSSFGGVAAPLFSEKSELNPTHQRKKHQSKHQSQRQRKHQSKHIKASIKPQTSLRVFPHLRVLPHARLAPCAPCPPVQPARLARGQACAEPVSQRPGCVFLCMISVSLRPSVRVRRPDLPRPGLRRGGKLARGAGRAASDGERRLP